MARLLLWILLLAMLGLGLGGCVGVSQTSAPTAAPSAEPTLPPHHPSDRLPLPEGSVVRHFTTLLDGNKQIDSAVITLPLKKAEAAAYFKPLLEKDAEYYTESESAIVPPEILGAYPQAAGQLELFARYSQAAGKASVMRVSLFTLADGETVAASQIQITYNEKPE